MSFVKFQTVLIKPVDGMPELDAMVGKRIELIALEVDPVPQPSDTKVPRFGTAKGTIWMADDFDAPLDDFKDYM